MKSNKGQFIQGKETFQRINFLWQAAELLTQDPNNLDFALACGKVMVSVSKKCCVRMDPEVKRKICKGCEGMLIPGVTARVRIKKKPNQRVIWSCLRCGTLKRFMAKKGYKTWSEKEESVAQHIVCTS